MKITHSSKIQSLILAAALSIGLGFVSPVSAQQIRSYIVDSNGKGLTDLGTLGGDFTYAIGINDTGQVAGYSATAAGAVPCLYHWPQWRGHDRSRDARWRFHSVTSRHQGRGQVVGWSRQLQVLPCFITGPMALA